MGEVIRVTRDLTEPYNTINIYKNKGSCGFCGFGVRDRDDETALATTYFDTTYSIAYGNISHVKFRTASVTDGAASLKVGFFSYTAGDTRLILVGERTLAAPVGGWVGDTVYTIELSSAIYLSSSVGVSYYLSFYSPDPGVKIDCSADSGIRKGYSEAADDFAAGFALISGLTESEVSISFEAWGQPAGWVADLVGGAISDVTEDWFSTEVGDFTFLAGDLTNIETDGPVIQSAGNGSYVAVDLANGQIPTGVTSSDEFPDYATTGLRAVSRVHLTGEMKDADGILVVLVNTADTVALPVTGWQNLGYIQLGAPGLFDETINIPALTRWIKIAEASDVAPGDIEINQLIVEIITIAVDDGEYPVDHTDAVHDAWVTSNPTEDTLYRCCFKNAAGATSPFSEQITNRTYRD